MILICIQQCPVCLTWALRLSVNVAMRRSHSPDSPGQRRLEAQTWAFGEKYPWQPGGNNSAVRNLPGPNNTESGVDTVWPNLVIKTSHSSLERSPRAVTLSAFFLHVPPNHIATTRCRVRQTTRLISNISINPRHRVRSSSNRPPPPRTCKMYCFWRSPDHGRRTCEACT